MTNPFPFPQWLSFAATMLVRALPAVAMMAWALSRYHRTETERS